MLRAVPAIMRIAASTSVVLRSAFFVSTICLRSSLVTLRALGETGSFLQQHARGRRLALQREAAVLVDGDNHGDHETGLLLRLGVELLAELHDVHAGGTERRTHGRRGIRGTGGNLEFDNSLDLLSHFFPSLSAKPPGIPTGADGPQNQRLLLRLRLHVLHGHLLDLPVIDVDRDLAAEDVDFNLEFALVGIHH